MPRTGDDAHRALPLLERLPLTAEHPDATSSVDDSIERA
jgi:hypothetical protein